MEEGNWLLMSPLSPLPSIPHPSEQPSLLRLWPMQSLVPVNLTERDSIVPREVTMSDPIHQSLGCKTHSLWIASDAREQEDEDRQMLAFSGASFFTLREFREGAAWKSPMSRCKCFPEQGKPSRSSRPGFLYDSSSHLSGKPFNKGTIRNTKQKLLLCLGRRKV